MSLLNPIVFLDVSIHDEKVGRIIIELFADLVPIKSKNFLALCLGNHVSKVTGKKLHYKGTIFHKVVPNVFIQGGDVTNLDGSAGESIFEDSFGEDSTKLKHDRPGVVSAIKWGQWNTNNSQFIITVGECTHLDGDCVVFGQVRKGLGCAIEISSVSSGVDEKPTLKCYIADCGQIKPGEPWDYIENDETNDIYPADPRDFKLKNYEIFDMLELINEVRRSGNYFFSKRNFIKAGEKYKKSIRYIEYWTSPEFTIVLNDSKKKEIYQELEKAKMLCFLNAAAVGLKKGLFRQCLNLCNEVVKKEKSNAKAYFRMGKALKHLNDFEGALIAQNKALSLAPNNKFIIEEIKEVNEMKKSYLVQEKEVFSRMFLSFK